MRNDVTFTIIKPNALKYNKMGPIFELINRNGFQFIALKMVQMTPEIATEFYKEHIGKPFFEPLVEYMASGPIVVAVLQKENAIADFRELIGNTDPLNAKIGTIRKMFAEDQRHNAIHGSDSAESALREMGIFFKPDEIFEY